MIDLKLPGPIAAYFSADRRDNGVVARCFAQQAIVKDEGHTYSGSAAIKAWRIATSTKYSYTSEPCAVVRQDDCYIVTVRLTGDFPGSPIAVRFVFRLERGKIALLEITP